MADVNDIIFAEVPDSIKEDIEIINGDFKVEASDQMHIQHILKAQAGQYYQHPLVGLGVAFYRSASLTPQRLKQLIKTQLKADNYGSILVEVGNDYTVNIDATRLK